jgi:hypothetical protein
MRKARVHSRARYSRVLGIVTGLILAPALAGSGSASAQGLFEALFGRGAFQPAPPARAPSPFALPGYEGQPRLQYRRPPGYTPKRVTRAPASRIETSAKPAPYVAPPVMPGPLGRFLRDPTLRRGDVVATADGLMVFRGSAGSRHSEKDFVPLSRGGALVAARARTELARLNRAVRAHDGELESSMLAEVAQKEPPIVAQDEGRRVRR